MNTKLYVGNLSFDTTENDLQDLFAQHGPVSEVNLITDRMSGRSRGFAFVLHGRPPKRPSLPAAGKEIQGRALTVNEARLVEEHGGGGGGGGGRFVAMAVVEGAALEAAAVAVVHAPLRYSSARFAWSRRSQQYRRAP